MSVRGLSKPSPFILAKRKFVVDVEDKSASKFYDYYDDNQNSNLHPFSRPRGQKNSFGKREAFQRAKHNGILI
jgi:hypothetical protein